METIRHGETTSPPHSGRAKPGSDPPRTVPGMPQRERHDPLLNQHRELVAHHRPPPLAGQLQPLPIDLSLQR